MNLEQLRTLVAVVEHGSMSAAARALRISQPAVTKQMQRLEQELDVPLLVRGPRQRVSLTAAGEQVLAFAREFLAGLETLHQELALLKDMDRGSLTLAASTIPGEYLLPALLAAFRRQYPRIQAQLTITDTSDVARRVLSGEAGVGFVGAAVERPGLRLERLVGDEIVLAVPPDHPFAARKRVPFDALRGQPLIMREPGSGTRRSLEEALAAAGKSLPHEDVVLTLGSSQAVLQAVQQGLGLGFISARAATQRQAAGTLACVRLEGLDLTRDFYLAYLPSRLADSAVAAFLAFTRSQFAH
jgi:DNA-binding transcriptional LysR family regulator